MHRALLIHNSKVNFSIGSRLCQKMPEYKITKKTINRRANVSLFSQMITNNKFFQQKKYMFYHKFCMSYTLISIFLLVKFGLLNIIQTCFKEFFLLSLIVFLSIWFPFVAYRPREKFPVDRCYVSNWKDKG